MLVYLRKNQVNYLGKSSSQTNNLRRQYRKISWYLFNKKSPLDSDKSYLCICMISNWYFESPVALVWPGLPLGPDTPDPLYFSFNHSVMSNSQDNKLGAIPVSCAALDVAPNWSLTPLPPKGRKCHREITLEFLTPDKTYLRNGRRMGTRSSPRSLLCPKWRASWYMISTCKASFGYRIWNKSFLFYYPALLTVHSFLTDGFIYSALKDSEITGHINTAINCSWYVCTKLISMYAWSCSFTGGYLQKLCRPLTDMDYMLTNVFVKLTSCGDHIKKSGLTKYGDFPYLEQERRIVTWNWI